MTIILIYLYQLFQLFITYINLLKIRKIKFKVFRDELLFTTNNGSIYLWSHEEYCPECNKIKNLTILNVSISLTIILNYIIN